MERTTIHRPIQGGGQGSGFQVPHQILRKEESLLPIIARDTLFVAEKNRPHQSSTNTDPSEVNRYNSWINQLQNRLFYIDQRRKESRYANTVRNNNNLYSSEDIVANLNKNATTTIQSGATALLHASNILSNSVSPPPSNVNGRSNSYINNNLLHCPQLLHAASSETTTTVKFIPPLPKRISHLVKLWRYGDGTFKPVRLFEKAEGRKDLVSNYTNSLWTKTGQKNAYLRIRKIMQFIHEFCPLTCYFWDEGRDKHWDRGLNNFYKEFGHLKDKPLSTLLKEISRFSK